MWPNVAPQPPRATGIRHETETPSRGWLQVLVRPAPHSGRQYSPPAHLSGTKTSESSSHCSPDCRHSAEYDPSISTGPSGAVHLSFQTPVSEATRQSVLMLTFSGT